ncbi:phage holin family protein [Flavobacterium sp. 25HG05S-40]|uniref:phage holin family protein n=1 Tax=Flavobacterium sp. 25HG05S-40 TaxID=3458682 RepID=UPI004044C8F9
MNQFLSHLVYPSPYLIVGLMIMIFLDLLSGIQKANKNHEATSSRGLRYSFDKATTYFSLIVAVLVIVNITVIADKDNHFKGWLDYSINGLFILCCYVEFKSILENLIEINTRNGQKNAFCKLVLVRFHNTLILKFK